VKYFFITVDTEGDNLWNYKEGDRISTENSRHIPRFQNLCEKYGFKPTYLVNHEMASDDFFCSFAGPALRGNNCEIGMHLHAWNSPPIYDFVDSSKDRGGPPYLTEYPVPVMRQKFDALFKLLSDKFQCRPVSHRSGRWAMNQDYFDLLIDYGIKIDCSVTPHMSWKSSKGRCSGGSDYRRSPEEPFAVKHSSGCGAVTEIPVTIRKFRFLSAPSGGGGLLKKCLVSARNALLGKAVWLRPNGYNLFEMSLLAERIKRSESGYIMFMLHSSELMPGGSPTFKTAESIERLYSDVEIIFKNISNDFKGVTLKDFYALGVNK